MAEINWTVVTYLVIGLFVLNGLFRGWWKEAITTAFLAVLVFFLQQPPIAEAVVSLVNRILDTVWLIIPNSLASIIGNVFEDVFAVSTNGGPLQFDPGDANTWLIALFLFIGLASLISRSSLPNYRDHGYRVGPMGGFLGGLIGGLNGFIIIGLIQEYLKGGNLPASTGSFPTEIASRGGGGFASSGIGFQATDVPNVTLMDSFLPWIIIIAGVLIFLVALNNRVALRSDKGFRKVDYRIPLGYREY